MLRFSLGNFPPQSKAHLRAYCSQHLELDDNHYCFRLPMAYVPAYLGNVTRRMEEISEADQQAEDFKQMLIGS